MRKSDQSDEWEVYISRTDCFSDYHGRFVVSGNLFNKADEPDKSYLFGRNRLTHAIF